MKRDGDPVSLGSDLAGYAADAVQAAPEAVVTIAEMAGVGVAGTAAVAAAPVVGLAALTDSVSILFDSRL